VTSLLDVNALIALFDSEHIHHEAMHAWFAANAQHGWATCPLTENAAVRILAQAAYPSGQRTPAEMIGALRLLKTSHRGTHEFWADIVTLTDDKLFAAEFIIGSKHLTDAYLLGLAAHHQGRVVSFDRTMPWQAVVGGSAALLISPGVS
jgi:toxin-antitoxin system PIN domain toxin